MKQLFHPAIACMKHLRYPHKFAVISILFALPLALVLYFLISEINTAIDVAQYELYGTAYLRPLRQLLEHVPLHSLLTHDYLAGSAAICRGELLNQQLAIDADIVALENVDQHLGRWLHTTARFQSLRANWHDLKDKLTS